MDSCGVHLASRNVRPWQGRRCAHRVRGGHPGAGALCHGCRSIPPVRRRRSSYIATLHIILCQLFVSPLVGEMCTTECHPSSCVFICTWLLVYFYRVCVRVSYAQIDLSTRGMRSARWKHTRRVYVLLYAPRRQKKREEKTGCYITTSFHHLWTLLLSLLRESVLRHSRIIISTYSCVSIYTYVYLPI